MNNKMSRKVLLSTPKWPALPLGQNGTALLHRHIMLPWRLISVNYDTVHWKCKQTLKAIFKVSNKAGIITYIRRSIVWCIFRRIQDRFQIHPLSIVMEIDALLQHIVLIGVTFWNLSVSSAMNILTPKYCFFCKYTYYWTGANYSHVSSQGILPWLI